MISLQNTPQSPSETFSFSRGERVIVVCGCIAHLFALAPALSHADISACVFYGAVALFSAAFLVYALWLFRHAVPGAWGPARSRKVFLGSLSLSVVGGMALEALTISGQPLSSISDPQSWRPTDVALFSYIVFAICSLCISMRLRKGDDTAQGMRSWTHLSTPKILALMLFGLLYLSLTTGVWTWRYEAVPERLCFLLLGSAFTLTVILWVGRQLSSHPEKLFVILCMCFGFMLCVMLPPVTGISYDDQVHFDRSLGLSRLGRAEYSSAEKMLATCPWVHDSSLGYANLDEMVDYLESNYRALDVDQAGMRRVGPVSPTNGTSLLTITTFGYIPCALGLWLAHVLGLGLSATVILGRLSNLVFFCIVFSQAVRLMPIKKNLLVLIGLLPSNIYLASNYSYDPWVTSFLALGIALVLREATLPRPISMRALLPCGLALLFGLCPKAIYFPVLLLLLILPPSKLTSNGKRALLGISILFLLCVSVLSFVLPLLLGSGGGYTDSRGGDGVDAARQISWVLHHPLAYGRTLATFMLGYFAPLNSGQYTLDYPSYIGKLSLDAPHLVLAPYLMLIVVALLDVDDSDRTILPSPVQRVLVFALFLASVTLIASSMYVSFTPVAAESIEGCQGRYLLPVLILGLMPFSLRLAHRAGDTRAQKCLPALIGCTAALFSAINLVAYVVFV